MPFMPFQIVGIWLRGLLALAIPILAILCLKWWYDDSWVVERTEVVRAEVRAGRDLRAAVPRPATVARGPRPRRHRSRGRGGQRPRRQDWSSPEQRVFRFEPGWNRATAELAGMVLLLAWALVGRWIGKGLSAIRLGLRGSIAGARVRAHRDRQSWPRCPVPTGFRAGARSPPRSRNPRSLTICGPARCTASAGRTAASCASRRTDPTTRRRFVFTHGWGANADEWYYQKQHLAGRFRLIVWDLAGLGYSTQPDNRDYSLEKMAADLEAVLALAGDGPPCWSVTASAG